MLHGPSQANLWPFRCSDCSGELVTVLGKRAHVDGDVYVISFVFLDAVWVHADSTHDSSQESESELIYTL